MNKNAIQLAALAPEMLDVIQDMLAQHRAGRIKLDLVTLGRLAKVQKQAQRALGNKV